MRLGPTRGRDAPRVQVALAPLGKFHETQAGVVELRDKVDRPHSAAGTAAGPGSSSVRDQVIEALVGLGFAAPIAEKTVIAVLADQPGADSATVLRAGLASLGRSK